MDRLLLCRILCKSVLLDVIVVGNGEIGLVYVEVGKELSMGIGVMLVLFKVVWNLEIKQGVLQLCDKSVENKMLCCYYVMVMLCVDDVLL